MHLYNLTLQKPSGIVCAVYGNFSGPKAQEIIVSRGKIIELLRPDDSGRLQVILSVDVFGVVRSLIPFRLTGGTKDYLVVGSDSGRIVILEYNPTTNRFDKVHQETFGKSGCRRIVPGQYLAADPKGRAVLIGSVEKQKLVYVLNRDASARLTISSPLEAHKAHTILFSVVGVDVGFDNPIFACIEVDYEEEGEEGQKHLTYYELDLGLNHVSRKWSEPINPKSNMLITVPGSSDGPSGVLICSENYITYKHQGHPSVVAKIPRRRGHLNGESVLIVASALVKQKDMFFFLLQSEYGDLYKVTLSYKEDAVQAVNIEYFDTVAVATSLCVMKTGFLFVASEFGNHFLYQFKPMDEQEKSIQDADMEIEEEWQHFVPHKERNLLLIDEMSSLSPIIDMKIADLCHEETPQIYAACGRGPHSTLRILRHGIPVSEMAVSPLPGNPSAVWTIRQSMKEEYDKYIVVSFVNATLVLAVGETVEEASDTGFLNNVPTLHVANMGDDGMVQVHPTGIRHIRGEGKRIHEWKTPGKKTITHASSNTRQLAIALSGGDIVYFELDQSGQLADIDKKFMGREIACLDIAPIPKGRQRTRFLAVGDWDNTLRILSLDPQDSLQALSLQALPTLPESLAIVEMSPIGTTPGTDNMNNLFINIGLNNGVLLRSIIDTITGELSDTRTRFLGSRPVKLLKISLKESSQQKNAILALSSRTWLGYNNESRFEIVPLSYSTLEHAATFTSEPCPEGIVAIAGNTLRIFTIDRLGEIFNQNSIPLLYTPRKLLIHPLSNHVITIESDHNTLPDTPHDNNNVEGHNQRQLREIKGGNGVWASCIRLMDVSSNPSSPTTLDVIQMTDNEAALCMCTCVFHDRDGEVMVVVGTAKDLVLKPYKASCGFIHVYKVTENQLELVHKTPIEMPPTALCAFQGRLLVGMGSTLRIYDLGKKKLLRKCESRNFGNCITQIWTQGDRLYVSDVQESVAFAKYKKSENQLYIFADETSPRWLTSTCVLDYDTISGVDKFGNIFVSRLPGQVSDEVEEDPTGTKLKVEQGFLNGATHKLDDVIQFHIGDTCNVVLKNSLVPGGAEALLFGGMMGTIGALLPFMSREDIDFFTHLEMYMRQENPPLCGRDHLSYRSYYFPVKNVIDGDLCEQFYSLPSDKQRSIANELERTPLEVMKKLEDMRNRLL